MKHKLLALDLDGTLLTPFKNITDIDLKALKEYSQNDGEISIVTGRSISSARKYIKKVKETTGKKIKYSAVLCGALIVDENENFIKKTYLDDEVALKIYKKIEEMRLKCWIYSEDAIKKNGVLTKNKLFVFFSKIYLSLKLFNFNLSDIKDVAKINIYSFSPKKLRKIASWLKKELADYVQYAIVGGGHQIEVYSNKCSKGEAIRFIANKLNIPMNQTAAIGDSANDIPAMETVKLSISLGGNKLLNQCTTCNIKKSKSGVVKAIHEIIFNNQFNQVKLFVTDLDGTLLNKDSVVSDLAKKEVTKYIPTYINNFCACTGRHINKAHELVSSINLPNQTNKYLISDNGAIVFDINKQKIIYIRFINYKSAAAIFDLAKSFNKCGAEVRIFDYEETLKEISSNLNYFAPVYNINKDYVTKSFLSRHPKFAKNKNLFSNHIELENISKSDNICSFVFYFDNDKDRTIFIKKLNALDLPIKAIPSGKTILQITDEDVSKGYALKILTNYLKIELNNAMVLGNDYNDISMLKHTQWSFVTKNSDVRVKDASNYVINGQENKLVQDAFELYLKECKLNGKH